MRLMALRAAFRANADYHARGFVTPPDHPYGRFSNDGLPNVCRAVVDLLRVLMACEGHDPLKEPSMTRWRLRRCA